MAKLPFQFSKKQVYVDYPNALDIEMVTEHLKLCMTDESTSFSNQAWGLVSRDSNSKLFLTTSPRDQIPK